MPRGEVPTEFLRKETRELPETAPDVSTQDKLIESSRRLSQIPEIDHAFTVHLIEEGRADLVLEHIEKVRGLTAKDAEALLASPYQKALGKRLQAFRDLPASVATTLVEAGCLEDVMKHVDAFMNLPRESLVTPLRQLAEQSVDGIEPYMETAAEIIGWETVARSAAKQDCRTVLESCLPHLSKAKHRELAYTLIEEKDFNAAVLLADVSEHLNTSTIALEVLKRGENFIPSRFHHTLDDRVARAMLKRNATGLAVRLSSFRDLSFSVGVSLINNGDAASVSNHLDAFVDSAKERLAPYLYPFSPRIALEALEAGRISPSQREAWIRHLAQNTLGGDLLIEEQQALGLSDHELCMYLWSAQYEPRTHEAFKVFAEIPEDTLAERFFLTGHVAAFFLEDRLNRMDKRRVAERFMRGGRVRALLREPRLLRFVDPEELLKNMVVDQDTRTLMLWNNVSFLSLDPDTILSRLQKSGFYEGIICSHALSYITPDTLAPFLTSNEHDNHYQAVLAVRVSERKACYEALRKRPRNRWFTYEPAKPETFEAPDVFSRLPLYHNVSLEEARQLQTYTGSLYSGPFGWEETHASMVLADSLESFSLDARREIAQWIFSRPDNTDAQRKVLERFFALAGNREEAQEIFSQEPMATGLRQILMDPDWRIALREKLKKRKEYGTLSYLVEFAGVDPMLTQEDIEKETETCLQEERPEEVFALLRCGTLVGFSFAPTMEKRIQQARDEEHQRQETREPRRGYVEGQYLHEEIAAFYAQEYVQAEITRMAKSFTDQGKDFPFSLDVRRNDLERTIAQSYNSFWHLIREATLYAIAAEGKEKGVHIPNVAQKSLSPGDPIEQYLYQFGTRAEILAYLSRAEERFRESSFDREWEDVCRAARELWKTDAPPVHALDTLLALEHGSGTVLNQAGNYLRVLPRPVRAILDIAASSQSVQEILKWVEPFISEDRYTALASQAKIFEDWQKDVERIQKVR